MLGYCEQCVRDGCNYTYVPGVRDVGFAFDVVDVGRLTARVLVVVLGIVLAGLRDAAPVVLPDAAGVIILRPTPRGIVVKIISECSLRWVGKYFTLDHRNIGYFYSGAITTHFLFVCQVVLAFLRARLYNARVNWFACINA